MNGASAPRKTFLHRSINGGGDLLTMETNNGGVNIHAASK
jgi:hypothetical protein